MQSHPQFVSLGLSMMLVLSLSACSGMSTRDKSTAIGAGYWARQLAQY